MLRGVAKIGKQCEQTWAMRSTHAPSEGDGRWIPSVNGRAMQLDVRRGMGNAQQGFARAYNEEEALAPLRAVVQCEKGGKLR